AWRGRASRRELRGRHRAERPRGRGLCVHRGVRRGDRTLASLPAAHDRQGVGGRGPVGADQREGTQDGRELLGPLRPVLAAASSQLGAADVRLLTLTGPGGAGKTRLALEVARAVSENFASGVFFVGLAPIKDPDRVAAAIAHKLEVREVAGKALADRLVDY